MQHLLAQRMAGVPRSFIREILKATQDPEVISFAGGLPNRALFPLDEIQHATNVVFEKYGRDVLQYSASEGDIQLREYIRARYQVQQGLDIPLEQILITSGSQQGLDLIAKTILDPGDGVVLEAPGYLGAIQAFSVYQPEFLPVALNDDGLGLVTLERTLNEHQPKLLYSVSQFQNPSGMSYSEANKQGVADLVRQAGTLLIDDNPYGDLRFSGEPTSPFRSLLGDAMIMLGSFSKVVVPGFRLGWLVAPDPLLEKLVTAKQATDLHTSAFTQKIIYQYLVENDLNQHIRTITEVYGEQCQAMLDAIERYFPDDIAVAKPEGGMFLWVTLPKTMAAIDLFEIASKDKVVFVPGDPFYVNRTRVNTLRLNFSCSDAPTTEIGIKRLAKAIEHLRKRGQT